MAARNVPTAAMTATPSARQSSTIHRPRTPPRNSRRARRSAIDETGMRSPTGTGNPVKCRHHLDRHPAVREVHPSRRTRGEVRVVGDQHQRGAGRGAQRETAGPSRPRRSPDRGCRSARRRAATAAAERTRGPRRHAAARRRKAGRADGSADGRARPLERRARPAPWRRGRRRVRAAPRRSPARSSSGSGGTPGTRCRSVARRSRASASSSIAVMACPSSRMLPELARSRPASTISRLVLPEPDGPMRPTASPAAMSRSMPRRMLTGPAAEGTVRCRFLTVQQREPETAEWHPWRQHMASAPGGGKPSIVLAMVLSAASDASPVRLLVLGNSLSAGYGLAHADGFEAQLSAALRAHGHDVRIVDGAVSGDTTAGGRARLDWALGDGADAAIVELGANDGLRGVDPAGHGGEPGRHPRRAGGPAYSGAAERHVRAAQPGAGVRGGVPRRVRPAGGSGRACCTTRSSWTAWRPNRH